MDKQTANLLKKCNKHYSDFVSKTGGIDLGIERGILCSEAFFVRSIIDSKAPAQLIESGRAQGQSTLLIGRSLPNVSLLSFELDIHHPDSKIALQRLNGERNVTCLFGDSTKIMPHLAIDGDILIIDGPKDMNALLLLSKITKQKNIDSAFIHDAYHGSLLRSWLDRFRPQTCFSDNQNFLQKYCHMDNCKSSSELEFWSNPLSYPTKKVYGGTFAYLSKEQLKFTIFEILSIRVYKVFSNLSKSIRKRMGEKYQKKHPCSA